MKCAVAFIILFTGAAAAQTAPTLSSKGLAPVEIGMSSDGLERVLRAKVPYSEYANNGCGVVTTREMEPLGLSFMIEAKRVTRISLDFYGTDPRPLEIKTDTGVGLGSTEEDVLKAYGTRARVEPNPQDPTWHTIIVDDPDQTRAIIFETNGKSVKSIRAGEYPDVASRTGCD